MSEFDVAVGMSQGQLDAVSAALFQQVPSLFTGTQQTEVAGIPVTATWTIEKPAMFDLSSSSSSGFAFTYPAVEVVLTTEGVAESTVVTTQLTASAKVVASGATLALEVTGVSAPPQRDGTTDHMVRDVVLPAVQRSADEIFGAVTIPPIELPGVKLTAPVPVIQSGALIAVANLAERGPPAVPQSFAWPVEPFFVLLSGATMQALANSGARPLELRRSTRTGEDWFGEKVSIDMTTEPVQLTIEGAQLSFRTQLSGGVRATVRAFHLEIPMGIDVYAEPRLSGTLSLVPQGNQLVVSSSHVDNFKIFVKPAGSVPERITGAMVAAITDLVLAIAQPGVEGYLHALEFPSYSIPVYHVQVSGVTVTATPVDLIVSGLQGMLAVTGQVQIGT